MPEENISGAIDLERRIEERAARRLAALKDKIEKAEILKEKGNQLFMKGEYDAAIECWWEASGLRPHEPAYHSNTAAAFLKLARYDEAEAAAHAALLCQPDHLKARFRRGLARKGRKHYDTAVVDFRVILSQLDPTNNLAKAEIAICEKELKGEDWYGDDRSWREQVHPCLACEKWEVESASDTSDCNHYGIANLPCQDYNRAGCSNGTACPFNHAADAKSVRDNLGKNVCIRHILKRCPLFSARCPYSHDLHHLPAQWTFKTWQERETFKNAYYQARVDDKQDPDIRDPILMRYPHLGKDMRRLPYVALQMTREYELDFDPRRDEEGSVSSWASTSSSERDSDDFGSVTSEDWNHAIDAANASYDTSDGALQEEDGEERQKTQEREERERRENHGFTLDEVDTLAEQGVKPWDPQAKYILSVLSY
ncbi:hypothetical protein OE88DRAFT_926688 [Heliocybe sulcata]|uniref:C3H1-type domain-containing protein n=1 Tax=Heliocybe sulcata TaxID=5364 RepID=A0A5C3MXT5_9AGAM|nr:hypothetical protein OE88DRAFT_926688 [Heliocybe sulcata]